MQILDNVFNSILMFKVNRIFLKQLRYSKIVKKGPFVSVTSLQRILSIILESICEEFKFWVVTDKKQGGGEKNYREPAELVRVILTSSGPKYIYVYIWKINADRFEFSLSNLFSLPTISTHLSIHIEISISPCIETKNFIVLKSLRLKNKHLMKSLL